MWSKVLLLLAAFAWITIRFNDMLRASFTVVTLQATSIIRFQVESGVEEGAKLRMDE
jgi:hypothetical protein